MKSVVNVLLVLVIAASCQSPVSSPRSPRELPAPRGLTAVAAPGRVDLHWSGTDGAKSYALYWSTQPGAQGHGTRISGIMDTSYAQVGMTNGTTCYYVVTAVDASGESQSSLEVSATPQVAVAGAPSGLAVSSGDNQTTLTWTDVADAASYNLYWSIASGVTKANGTKISGVTATSYSHTGLINGTTYYYVVTAVNAGGEGAASSQLSSTPQVAVAGAPTGLLATASNGQSTISWTATDAATNYNLYWSTASGVTKANGTKISGITATSYSHTGLINGTPYYYVVTAVNAGGEGEASSQSTATPQVPAPSVPTGLSATSGDAQVQVSWNAASRATSYNLYWSTSSGVTTGNGTKIAGLTGTSYAHTSLTNGTTYYYIVTAVNGGGESLAAAQTRATAQISAPPAPTGLAATLGNTQNQIRWTAVSGATSYNLYWSTLSGLWAISTKIAGLTSPSYTHTGLKNGTNYYYVVTAVNAGGEGPLSSEISSIPQVPAPTAPTELSAMGGNLLNQLAWLASSGATSYNLYWSLSPGVTPANGTKISGISGTSYTHSGLTNGTPYYYIVTAVNAGGEGSASSPAAGTPAFVAPQAPTGLAVTPGTHENTVSWTAAPGATSYNVYWATTSGVTTVTGTSITGIGGTSYTHSSLSPSSVYYYIVTAVNAAGESSATLPKSGVPLLSWTNYTTAQGLAYNGLLSVWVSGSNIYLGTLGKGVSVSTNGGASWSSFNAATNGLNGDFVYGIYGSGSTIYAACSNSGLSVSTNGGTSWTTYSSGVMADGVEGVAVSGSTILAAALTGLGLSTNGGLTWTSLSSGNFVIGATSAAISGSLLLVGTGGFGVEVSTNNGSSWTAYGTSQGMVNGLVLGVFLADGGTTMYAATNGGLSKSTNGGASWTNYTTAQGLGSNKLWGVWASGNSIYVATNGGGLSYSPDGGTTWTTYTTAQGLAHNSVRSVFVSGSTVYVATSGGGLSIGQ